MLLETRTVEKPWGRDTLPAPFTAPAGKRIGGRPAYRHGRMLPP